VADGPAATSAKSTAAQAAPPKPPMPISMPTGGPLETGTTSSSAGAGSRRALRIDFDFLSGLLSARRVGGALQS
jgi:hypothetical protein